MKMDVCAQTLVLIDNDLSVSGVNQKLTNATLKYLFYHSPENRAYSVNLYEHELCGEEEYVTDVKDLVCKADTLSYEAKDSNIVDTLTEVLRNWMESDFACRDIVIFTDGVEGAELYHEKEELYYLINNTDYPIYVVFLNQENNADCKKTLSAIATTSSGELIETEFPGDDAEIDRRITDKLFAKMDEYAAANWEEYAEDEEPEAKAEEVSETETKLVKETQVMSEEAAAKAPGGDIASKVLLGQDEDYNALIDGSSSDVILREEKPNGFFNSPAAFIVAFIGIAAALLTAVLGSMYVMRLRRRKDASDILPNENFAGKQDKVDKDGYKDNFGNDSYKDGFDDKTVLFGGEESFGDEYATRLLSDESAVTLKLVEGGNEDNSYTIFLGRKMSIGRNAGECDVVIPDDAVSKRHCSLCDEKGEVYVCDLSSSNGTFVNGRKVTRCRIFDGDELTIGSKSYSVRFA